MKVIDWFAGIGGFRRGMELAGHECVGFCEYDKYAVMSYTAMHLCTREQLDYLATLPLRQRQKEILKEEYRNGEWYADDVRRVDAGDIPEADCWCFGFPCQDISIAGKQAGLDGNRSSLFFEVMRLLDERKANGLSCPGYLFIENVKNILNVNRGIDFAKILFALDERGYDAEWSVLNSKNFGVPQNRERLFVIGHFRGRSTKQVFPVRKNENKNKVLQIAEYDVARKNSNAYRVYSPDGLAPTITAICGGGHMPSIKLGGEIRRLTPKEHFRLQGWDDRYFEKAELVNFDTALYKQAGNGVTVNVIKEIASEFE